jgi:hypothetical protein
VSLVGKGICFDTGGTNLKPHKGMLDMHTDMEGSAVAVGSLYALQALRSPLAVDCWLAITENRIGPLAYKPQDVVRARNGSTIQVIHTDAEGRMVLADTLSLAAEKKPRAIIDYATLTGACVYALTERYSGAFTNRLEERDLIEAAGRSSGERVWCFPMDADYDTDLDSSIADVMQCAVDGKGDHILAARFFWTWRPACAAAGSRTSARISRDSACAIRWNCCAGDGRRRTSAHDHAHPAASRRSSRAPARRRRHGFGGRLHGRALRARDRDAESQTAHHHHRAGRRLSPQDSGRAAARQPFRTVDDPVFDGWHPCR